MTGRGDPSPGLDFSTSYEVRRWNIEGDEMLVDRSQSPESARLHAESLSTIGHEAWVNEILTRTIHRFKPKGS